MNKKLIIFLILIVIMGLFSFFRKDKNEDPKKNEIILGMVLLEDSKSMDITAIVSELKNKWKLKIGDSEISNDVSVLTIDKYQVGISSMNMPIPGKEVEEASSYNYYWENGKTESAKHKGHVIVSILNGGTDLIKENLLFNKIISSILNNSKSIGVYIGGRSLLLSKEFYQRNLDDFSENDLPINNLIYFGIRKEANKNSVYTYGLKDFRKTEMEIIESSHNLDELIEMMYNLTSYVLENDVNLKDGETIGMSETQKLSIKLSPGKFLEGKTLKIEY